MFITFIWNANRLSRQFFIKTYSLYLIFPALYPISPLKSINKDITPLKCDPPISALQQWFNMYKPITCNTNLLTEETDSFVNKLDPNKVFKSKSKTLVPKKKGPVQPAGGQKGPSGPPSTSKPSSSSGNPVRKWVPSTPAPCQPTAIFHAYVPRGGPGFRCCVWSCRSLPIWETRITALPGVRRAYSGLPTPQQVVPPPASRSCGEF